MKLSASCPTRYKKPQTTPDFSRYHTKHADTLTNRTKNLFQLRKKAIKILGPIEKYPNTEGKVLLVLEE